MSQYLTQLVSYLVGKSAEIPVPRFLKAHVYGVVVRLLKIDISEAKDELHSYRSVQELFVRELKTGARIRPSSGSTVISPCDGTFRCAGPVSNDSCILVKGRGTSVTDLVASESYARTFEGGRFVNLYLSPKDYHRVHSPVSGTLTEIRGIDGGLLPVADWSIRRRPNLFAENERVVFNFDTPYGAVAVIMVGALNVGNIRTTATPHAEVEAGDEIGIFLLGSSVIILLPPSYPANIRSGEEFTVRLFESLETVSVAER